MQNQLEDIIACPASTAPRQPSSAQALQKLLDSSLDVQGRKNVLKLDYQDNGVGFNLSTVKRGLGLSNIQNRADAYRGHMRIKSSPGQGCHIRIIFPLKGHL